MPEDTGSHRPHYETAGTASMKPSGIEMKVRERRKKRG
jgi:hypothetical protein